MACTSTSSLLVPWLLKGLGSLFDGSAGKGIWKLPAHKTSASNSMHDFPVILVVDRCYILSSICEKVAERLVQKHVTSES